MTKLLSRSFSEPHVCTSSFSHRCVSLLPAMPNFCQSHWIAGHIFYSQLVFHSLNLDFSTTLHLGQTTRLSTTDYSRCVSNPKDYSRSAQLMLSHLCRPLYSVLLCLCCYSRQIWLCGLLDVRYGLFHSQISCWAVYSMGFSLSIICPSHLSSLHGAQII